MCYQKFWLLKKLQDKNQNTEPSDNLTSVVNTMLQNMKKKKKYVTLWPFTFFFSPLRYLFSSDIPNIG